MSEPALVLEVIESTGCSLLSPGDYYVFEGKEIRPSPGARICGPGLCSVFLKLRDLVRRTPPGVPIDPTQMNCTEEGCRVLFHVAPQVATPASAQPAANMEDLQARTRSATTMLREAGPFLTRISPDVAANLVAVCTSKHFEDGETILEEGVRGQEMYIVGDGEVEVVQTSPKDPSKKTVLAVLGMGECFGEMSLLTGQPTSAAIRARGEAAIMILAEAKFEEQLSKSPELNRVFSKLLADRLRAQNVTLEEELARGIRGRFSMISLPDLIQTLHGSRRSGTLVVQRENKEGRLVFNEGRLIAAAWNKLIGEDVLFEMNGWQDGDFCFEPGISQHDGEHKVGRDTMTLLMECARRKDEASKSNP